MKKILFSFVLLVSVMVLVSCGGGLAIEVSETTADAPPSTTLKIIDSGESAYVIVHDGSEGAASLAAEISTYLKVKFSTEIKVSEENQGRYRIVVGAVGEDGETEAKKLVSHADFAVSVKEDTLYLSAPNVVSYHYLLTYLKKEVLVRKTGNSLILSPENEFHYAESELKDTDLIEYQQKNKGKVNLEDYFSPSVFKHEGTSLLYRIYAPFKFEPEKKYPVYVNLHGAGIRGSDNKRPLAFVKSLFSNEELSMEDCIVIVPQCPEGQKWVDTDWNVGSYDLSKVPESNELAAVVALVESVMKEYPVDTDRIYAAGFSMGGYGTWNLLMNHPDLFAAGVPMCGAASPTSANLMVNVPVWTIHGAKDPTVPVEGSREMVEALREAGSTVVLYTELPEHDHNVWDYTYKNTEIYTWLFSQKKS